MSVEFKIIMGPWGVPALLTEQKDYIAEFKFENFKLYLDLKVESNIEVIIDNYTHFFVKLNITDDDIKPYHRVIVEPEIINADDMINWDNIQSSSNNIGSSQTSDDIRDGSEFDFTELNHINADDMINWDIFYN